MFVTGVDENGLGPLLGPLTVTAVTLSVPHYRAEHWLGLARDLGIGDSKKTAGFGKMARAEGLTLALCEHLSGQQFTDVDSLLSWLALVGPLAMQTRCPKRSSPQCWSQPLTLPCFGGDLGKGRATLDALRRGGAEVERVRTHLACAGELNARLKEGTSRVAVDLERMEELVLDARRALKRPITAVCGMVGGIRNYPEKWRFLPRARAREVESCEGELAYDIAGVGQVRFEIDADARHLPVAFASMVGKYIRELWMERQNRFYQGHDDGLGPASGYHDPVTRRFVARSHGLRLRLGIDSACFVRESQGSQTKRHAGAPRAGPAV